MEQNTCKSKVLLFVGVDGRWSAVSLFFLLCFFIPCSAALLPPPAHKPQLKRLDKAAHNLPVTPAHHLIQERHVNHSSQPFHEIYINRSVFFLSNLIIQFFLSGSFFFYLFIYTSFLYIFPHYFIL